MDRFRTAIGVLALAWYTHWALTAPVPAPRAPKVVGEWTLVWQTTKAPCWLMKDGAWGCQWSGSWWYGKWTHTSYSDGSSTLTVDEGFNGSGCQWTAMLEPCKRSGKLVGGGTFALEKPK